MQTVKEKITEIIIAQSDDASYEEIIDILGVFHGALDIERYFP